MDLLDVGAEFPHYVDFPRRTARDFLESKEAQDLLIAAPDNEVATWTVICKATLAQIKPWEPGSAR